KVVKDRMREGMEMKDAVITIFGFTFKENVPDIRNTRVIDTVKEIESYGLTDKVTQDEPKPEDVKQIYNIDVIDQKDTKRTEAIILAVPYDIYLEKEWSLFEVLHKSKSTLVFDVKRNLERKEKPNSIVLRRL